MSLKIRFRFDGKCSTHPRYNPERDGRPQHKDCPGCDALWVIHLYTGIARRKAESGDGILVARPEAQRESLSPLALENEDPSELAERQGDESPDLDPTPTA